MESRARRPAPRRKDVNIVFSLVGVALTLQLVISGLGFLYTKALTSRIDLIEAEIGVIQNTYTNNTRCDVDILQRLLESAK